MFVKLNTVFAHFRPLLYWGLNILHICPTVDELHYFKHWELQLYFVLSFEPFPFFPILKPLSEYFDFVSVCISMIRGQRSSKSHWHDVIIFLEWLLCAWRLASQQEQASFDQMLNRLNIDWLFVVFSFYIDLLNLI